MGWKTDKALFEVSARLQGCEGVWNRVQLSPDGPKPSTGQKDPLLPAHHHCLQWTVTWERSSLRLRPRQVVASCWSCFAAAVWYMQESRDTWRTPGAKTLLCKVSIHCTDSWRPYLSTDSKLPEAMPSLSGSFKSITISGGARWPQGRGLTAPEGPDLTGLHLASLNCRLGC